MIILTSCTTLQRPKTPLNELLNRSYGGYEPELESILSVCPHRKPHVSLNSGGYLTVKGPNVLVPSMFLDWIYQKRTLTLEVSDQLGRVLVTFKANHRVADLQLSPSMGLPSPKITVSFDDHHLLQVANTRLPLSAYEIACLLGQGIPGNWLVALGYPRHTKNSKHFDVILPHGRDLTIKHYHRRQKQRLCFIIYEKMLYVIPRKQLSLCFQGNKVKLSSAWGWHFDWQVVSDNATEAEN
ncbi:MAG: hypothetical protein OXC40_02575 [Proteobacteria bacterium]|nr:hypothetical protein [Pseudomonadota bacterium]